MEYEEIKNIALSRAETYGVTIDKAYTLGDAFVFETKEEFVGTFPMVIDKQGNNYGLWYYLNEHDLTMDDMVEREL